MLKADKEELEEYGNRLLKVREPRLKTVEAMATLERFTDDLAEMVVKKLQFFDAESSKDAE